MYTNVQRFFFCIEEEKYLYVDINRKTKHLPTIKESVEGTKLQDKLDVEDANRIKIVETLFNTRIH